jgi:tRNA-dihydrouridine synthase A
MTEIKSKKRNYPDVRFAVAPMIDWSDLVAKSSIL